MVDLYKDTFVVPSTHDAEDLATGCNEPTRPNAA